MVKRYDLWMSYDEWQEDECDNGEWVKYDDHAAELATLRAENERMREALHGVYACHGSNPSYAMADIPEIDYIKYTLMTARRIAKEALK